MIWMAMVFASTALSSRRMFDLATGTERQLTHLPADFDIRDFDVSPDGREVVLERTQERSDVVLLDLPRP
jgi:MinD-like ATPase involved in chromosome partitioning or flagellar assembly